MEVITYKIHKNLKKLIKYKFSIIKNDIEIENKRINHINIYHRDWQNNNCDEIIEILKNEYSIDVNNLVSLAFITSQVNCFDQHFHIDYEGKVKTYFIPLIDLDDNNGTEFVKFNERCLVRLLGDMRSYNYVIDVTPDFEDTQYRIRAIDFDQQSYEGKKSLYVPQFYKENLPFVELCMKQLNENTVRQYQSEERSLMARRINTSRYRVNQLLKVMMKEKLSSEEKIDSLKTELSKHYNEESFLKCSSMGELMRESLNLLVSGKLN